MIHKGKLRRDFTLTALSICIASACGCMYGFTGALRSELKTVSIPMFENNTLKYGLETVFTEKAVDAFVEDGRLKVVAERNADSILLCTITGFSRAAFSYDESGNVKQEKVTITLNVLYKDAQSDEPIFEKEGMPEWGTYFLESATEDSAIAEAAKKFGRDIISEIVSAW